MTMFRGKHCLIEVPHQPIDETGDTIVELVYDTDERPPK